MNKEISLYEDRLKLQIPENFTESQELEKFMLSKKPDHFFVDQEKKAYISVNYSQEECSGDMENRLSGYYTLYQRTVPNFANCSMAKKKTNSGQEIGAFYYTCTTATKNLYNFFILTTLEGRDVTVTLHCDLEKVPEYGMQFMNIVDSIDVAG